MQSQEGHVLVVTYPAQGHINPLLQFAKRLASKGLKATVATTPYTFHSFHSAPVPVVPISDGFDDGGFKLAPSLEVYLETFKRVGSRALAELIQMFIGSGSPVSCIVYDSLLPWALDVARLYGISGAVFLTNSASVCSIYWKIQQGFLSLPVKQESLPLSIPGGTSLESSDLPGFLAPPACDSPYLEIILEKFGRLDENDWVFCNSFDELELKLMEAMKGLWSFTLIGPMVPSVHLDQQIEGDKDYGASLWEQADDSWSKWLDKKASKTVVYISFGTMANISAKQIEEIGEALKANKMPFLLVTREAKNMLSLDSISSDGEEVGKVLTWCNQLEVLAHPAVGCFVTHCGWNSTLEGLSLGVPMVAVPQWSDQPTNAKFVEEVWKVGVRAKRSGDGTVTKEELGRCLREVMQSERSEDLRKNASRWRELAKTAVSAGGSSNKNIEEFVRKLLEKSNRQPLIASSFHG